MVYEWDEKRARRAQKARVVIGLCLAAVAVAVPTAIAIAMKLA